MKDKTHKKNFMGRVIMAISLYFNFTMHTPSTGWQNRKRDFAIRKGMS